MAASWGICACCLEVDETVGQWRCGASSGWFTSMELIEEAAIRREAWLIITKN
jgi:hypothetical protein